MPSILFIKLTSLGDCIHALPALTDVLHAFPNAQLDWVIDESLQEIARLHPLTRNIITTNHRLWRKNLFSSAPSVLSVVKKIRQRHYDFVIDGQGNFKSALLAFIAKGKKMGFDKDSVREKIAVWAYDTKIAASWSLHAIDRLRILCARGLQYPMPLSPPQSLLQTHLFLKPSCPLPSSYLLFIPNAAWNTKLWPESNWKKLIELVDMPVLLPWGNEIERKRVENLAIFPNAFVLPKLSLKELAYTILHAKACVSLDTGFSHLASALNVPCVTLYGPTDPKIIGTLGSNQIQIQSTLPCSPCNQKQCKFTHSFPPCLSQLSAQQVLERVLDICNTLCGHCTKK